MLSSTMRVSFSLWTLYTLTVSEEQAGKRRANSERKENIQKKKKRKKEKRAVPVTYPILALTTLISHFSNQAGALWPKIKSVAPWIKVRA